MAKHPKEKVPKFPAKGNQVDSKTKTPAIATQDGDKALLPAERASITRPSKTFSNKWTITTSTANPISAMIQIEIARIATERPGMFPSSNTKNNQMSPAGFSFYLHWLAASYLKKVGSLHGAAVNAANMADPSPSLLVPNGLAKFLEYCAPYTDNNTGAVYQPQFQLDAWPTFASGSGTLSINRTNTDFVRWAQASFHYIKSFAVNNGEWLDTDVAPGEAFSLDTIIENADMYSVYLSGVSGVVPYYKIGVSAPDASASANRNNQDYMYDSVVPNYKADIAQMFWQNQTAQASDNSFFFTKPATNFQVVVGPGVTFDGFVGDWGNYFMGAWAYTLSKCTYTPGKVKKMLASCIFAGGAKLKSWKPCFVCVDEVPLKSLVGTVIQEQINNGNVGDGQWQGPWLIQTIAKMQLYARIAPYQFVLGSNGGNFWGNAQLWDPTVLDIPVDPMIADYISGIGPVNFMGTLVLPLWPQKAVSPFWNSGYNGLSSTSGKGWQEPLVTAPSTGPITFLGEGSVTVTFSQYATGRPMTSINATRMIVDTMKEYSPLGSGENVPLSQCFVPITNYKFGEAGVMLCIQRVFQMWTTATAFSPAITTYRSDLEGVDCMLVFDRDIVSKARLWTIQTNMVTYTSNTQADNTLMTPAKVSLPTGSNVLQTVNQYMLNPETQNSISVARGEQLKSSKADRARNGMGVIDRAIRDSAGAAKGLELPLYWPTDHVHVRGWVNSAWNTFRNSGASEILGNMAKRGIKAAAKTVLKTVLNGATGGIAGTIMDAVEALEMAPEQAVKSMPEIRLLANEPYV